MDKIVAKNLLKKIIRPDQMIKDNIVEFLFEKKQYRVNFPNHFDKVIAEEKKDERYMELLQGGKFKRRLELIEIYKKSGTDIEDFNIEFNRLGTVIQKKQIELNSLTLKIAEDENKEKIETIKQQIIALEIKQLTTIGDREELLRYSIEDKCYKYYILLLIIQCSEIYNDDSKTWIKLYENENDYNKGIENLNRQLCLSASYLFAGNKEEE